MLVLDRLTKRFGATVAVADVSLEVAGGEFLTLLGPSGCGKTTTLRMVAGFETPSGGRIRVGGRDVTSLPPRRREIGMVFQSYALFPHLNVFENVAFGLRARRVPRAEIPARVARALGRVDLSGYERRRVQELSGGQQQRVALARALAPEPPILLLDEPLSNLDAALRERTRAELRALLKALGITAVFVTHDQEEAFALSDRIAVMNQARLEQVGAPETLYHAPASPFVASFLGKANFLPGRVEALDPPFALCQLPGGARWRARLAGGMPAAIPVPAYAGGAGGATAAGASRDGAPARTGEAMEGAPAAAGDEVRVMIRPESLRLDTAGFGRDADTDDGLTARVVDRRFAGATTVYRLRAGEHELLAWGGPDAAAMGDEVVLRPAPEAVVYAFSDGIQRRGAENAEARREGLR